MMAVCMNQGSPRQMRMSNTLLPTAFETAMSPYPYENENRDEGGQQGSKAAAPSPCLLVLQKKKTRCRGPSGPTFFDDGQARQGVWHADSGRHEGEPHDGVGDAQRRP